MGVENFDTQEEMDDVFEGMMEREQDKARLRELIESQSAEVENCKYMLEQAEEELADLEEGLQELEQD